MNPPHTRGGASSSLRYAPCPIKSSWGTGL